MVIFVLSVDHALAQSQHDCPPALFVCIPWELPEAGGDPAPSPPPTFFEIEPSFIEPERFKGHLGRGEGSALAVTREDLPASVREAIRGYEDQMDPGKLYILPGLNTGTDEESGYIIFNGIERQ